MAEQKTLRLKKDLDASDAEYRDVWTCYEVLHDGEGPCRLPTKIEGIRQIRAEEAASYFAEMLADRERRESGYDAEDGDHFCVAVQTREDHALYFCVRVVIVRRFDAVLRDVPA